MMTEFNDLQKKYCSQALIVALIFSILLYLIEAKPAARGLILGSLFSILNFKLIAFSLPRQLNKIRKKSILFCLGSIWIRYLLMALPLILSVNSERFAFFATAIGLFMIQFIILSHHFGLTLLKKTTKTRKTPRVVLSETDDRPSVM